ncbi:MAG: PQQ-like beta-propeller repeat protein [Micrococcales bacterium]|nr:PQQ-like beta-propeller repeat protein [Micrococcales bacterium]MCL2666150.1 PQQ-like beta-propeller repeat protein [Micrococcales bacterium]
MLRKKRTLVCVGLLASLVLVGCTKSSDPQPSVSAGAHELANPVWSVRTQAVEQPELVDGLLLGEVFDPDSLVGASVVVWDDSGKQLWSHDGRAHVAFDIGSAMKVGYLVYRSETWSVAVADLRTGTESLVAMPGGRRADGLQKCDESVCVDTWHEEYSEWSRLDTASMTLVSTGWPSTYDYPDGIALESGSVSYEGDSRVGAWVRPYAEMFETESTWFSVRHVSVLLAWYGDREVLLGTTSAVPLDLEFDRSHEYATAGFAPDGTTVWKTYGRPCSAGEGGWTSGGIQVLCVSTGTTTYTTTTQPGSMHIEPTTDDNGNYWVGIDVRTGEQKWRFPQEGTLATPTNPTQYAPVVDDGYVLAAADDGNFLVDVTTGNAEPLDPDGAFLCPQFVRQTSPEAGTVFRNVRRVCNVDGNPVVASWNAAWVRLTGVTDGKGRYYVATASQLVAFDL